MGASLNTPAPLSPMERLYDITFRDTPQVSPLQDPLPFVRIQSDERADIDISGDAFDFVRSIRVFHIQFSQRQNRDGDCIRSDGTRLGSYGTQGDYHWRGSSIAAVPTASELPRPSGCGQVNYRSVFVDWRDHAGNYGSGEVRY